MTSSAYPAHTHDVINVSSEMVDVNLCDTDTTLCEAVQREGAGWAAADLSAFGAHIGTADYLELGALANRYPPELDTHDRFGHRVDLVRFHPAYHALMKTAIEAGIHSAPWEKPGPGAMWRGRRSSTCILRSRPARLPDHHDLRRRAQPARATRLGCTVGAAPAGAHYEPGNGPIEGKRGITMGMAMTEKQGGSDVRANTTQARSLGRDAGGEAYELVGHKFFVSAPMCDAFLTLAQTPAGLTCFLMPRWRPDGSKNPMQLQRLKRKMGNVSNASSETELRGALAWRVGDEGRGVRTIIEMVAMTRFDCMIGSSAGMRMALVQALHHGRRRKAFGALLSDQPLMRNVLADLALESEAATC